MSDYTNIADHVIDELHSVAPASSPNGGDAMRSSGPWWTRGVRKISLTEDGRAE